MDSRELSVIKEIRGELSKIVRVLKNEGEEQAPEIEDEVLETANAVETVEIAETKDKSETFSDNEIFIEGVLELIGGKMTDGENKKQTLLGIDLGTSRTAVISSGGHREMFSSVVGFPKDIIGVKLLGATQIIGGEAVDNRSYLDLCFPLKDGVIKEASERDLEAARELLRHAISVCDPPEGNEICAIIGVPARASIANKELLLNIAKEVMDIALVVSEPFMVAYNLNKLNNSIIIDIGAGTTDICGMKGAIPGPEDQVTILKGGDYIDELLESAISQRYPETQLTKHLICSIKEQYSFVGEAPQPVTITLRADGKPVEYDVTEEVKMACETIVKVIIEHIEPLIAGFDPEYQAEALRNIFIAGGGSKISGLEQVLTDRLKGYGEVNVTTVDEPEFFGCEGALKLASDLPPTYWDQIGEMISA